MWGINVSWNKHIYLNRLSGNYDEINNLCSLRISNNKTVEIKLGLSKQNFSNLLHNSINSKFVSLISQVGARN